MEQKTILDNGIRVLTETVPYYGSACIGVWVLTGSRDEEDSENGVSHFLEHLLFKGTERRTAQDIARTIDSVGGSLNGFTGRECTCFYAKVLDRNLDLAVDLLSDMLLNSKFDSQEIERERAVVLQEVKMVEDTPDDYVHDLFSRAFWGDHPMGQPVIGRSERIRSLSREQILRHFDDYYRSDRMIIAVAGNVEHGAVVDMVERAFAGAPRGSKTMRRGRPTGYSTKASVRRKKTEQVHLCLGTEGLAYVSSRRFASYVLNAVLGGGMSSRLFQEVRERRGLAYSIYSYLPSYADTGLLVVYAATEKQRVAQVVEMILKEFEALREKPISQDELVTSRQQLKGNLLLSLENSDNRMTRLAKNEIYFGRFLPVEEVIDRIDGVTVDEITELAADLFLPEHLCLTLLGPITRGELKRDLDGCWPGGGL
ncbi:MAG: insulinase family protein [Deltaproteobacteria bacterium]|nr:insulinase family protein [Deltaproteobacteria bacterium]MBW2121003.1 insulinase family protein [Deltaproteobacteria bacterium]